MREEAILSFLVQPFRTDVLSVTPVLNGVPLIELVSRFEGEQRFQPAGGYGGLIPEFFNYGSLSSYFLADFGEDSYFRRLRGIYVLGCQCGEVGCWPLKARVGSDKKSIIWDLFRQEHRPERDYSNFGPFIFDVDQYRRAVNNLEQEIAAHKTS